MSNLISLNANAGLRLASWNVRSLLSQPQQESLVRDLHRLNISIACIQETRLPGPGSRILDLSHTVEDEGAAQFEAHFSACETGGNHGVAIIYRRGLEILDVQHLGPRLMYARFKASPTHVSVVCGYAPHDGHTDDVRENFWQSLHTLLNSIPASDYLAVGVDANSRLFRPTDSTGWNGVGRFALSQPNSSPNSLALIDVLQEHQLSAVNTWFQPRRKRALRTFRCSRFSAQLDYLLVRRRHIGSVRRTDVLWNNATFSDHGCVRMSLHWRLKRFPKRPPAEPVFDTRVLRDDTIRQRYHAALDHHLVENHIPDMPVVAERMCLLWELISSAVRKAASETLPMKPCNRRPWLSAEAVVAGAHASVLRNDLRVPKAVKREAYKEFRQLRRRDHKARVTMLRDQLAAAHADNDLHTVFRLTKSFDPLRLATAPTVRREEIFHHFKRLVESASPSEPTPTLPNSPVAPRLPTLDEVRIAILSIRTGRVPGHDGIASDLLRWGSPRLVALIHEFVCAAYTLGEVPTQANTSHIVLLAKKPNPANVSDYRGISLLPSLYKVVEATIVPTLRDTYERIARDTQFGFRRERCCSDAISTLSRILERRHEFKLASVCCFLDFRSAFDSVSHVYLIETLSLGGVPAHLIRLISGLLRGTSQVRFGHLLSEPISHLRGTRQGALLSPLLFDFVMDRIMRDALTALPEVIDLLYADDVCLITTSVTTAQAVVDAVRSSAAEAGLSINANKSGILSSFPPESSRVLADGEPIPVVSSYKYLGTRLSITGRISPSEIPSRVACARITYEKLKRAVFAADLPCKLKAEIFSLAVRPALLYATETWGTSPTQLKRIFAADRRLLRRFCPAAYVLTNGVWTPCHNTSLHLTTGVKPVEALLNERRWNFFQRVSTSVSDTVKQIHLDCDIVLGKRRIGRPAITWHRLILQQAASKGIRTTIWKNLHRAIARRRVTERDG